MDYEFVKCFFMLISLAICLGLVILTGTVFYYKVIFYYGIERRILKCYKERNAVDNVIDAIEEDKGEISDGYHTFNELYEHRHLLFISLMCSNKEISWAAKKHDDGTSIPEWFVAGMNLPTGDITYHLPDEYIPCIKRNGITLLGFALKWDGHSSKDVTDRLNKWILRIH